MRCGAEDSRFVRRRVRRNVSNPSAVPCDFPGRRERRAKTTVRTPRLSGAREGVCPERARARGNVWHGETRADEPRKRRATRSSVSRGDEPRASFFKRLFSAVFFFLSITFSSHPSREALVSETRIRTCRPLPPRRSTAPGRRTPDTRGNLRTRRTGVRPFPRRVPKRTPSPRRRRNFKLRN